MVFRLPTPFGSLSPLSSNHLHRRPWRGTFRINYSSITTGFNGPQELFVASAETEGDKSSQTELWPRQFDVHFVRQAYDITDIQAWVSNNDIPLCMFMPDRHALGPNAQNNEANFRLITRFLTDNQLVCIAPWPNVTTLNGSGLLMFPNPSSSGLLTGAVFLTGNFPSFLFSASENPSEAIPSGLRPPISPFNNNPTTLAMYPPTSSTQAQQSEQQQNSTQVGNGQTQFPGYVPSQSHEYIVADSGERSNMAYYTHGMVMSYCKPQAQSNSELRQALTAAPFDWTVFDETTDGSGSTSPGSTRW